MAKYPYHKYRFFHTSYVQKTQLFVIINRISFLLGFVFVFLFLMDFLHFIKMFYHLNIYYYSLLKAFPYPTIYIKILINKLL